MNNLLGRSVFSQGDAMTRKRMHTNLQEMARVASAFHCHSATMCLGVSLLI
jgi:hypothetical protein